MINQSSKSFVQKVTRTRKTRSRRSSTSLPLTPVAVNEPSLPTNIVRYGIGLDVHKQTLAACVQAQLHDASIILIRQQRFNADPKGIQELIQFLTPYNPLAHCLMECTGVYHLPVYHALCKAFPENADKIIAMNPLLMNRRISTLGTKTDPIDAQDMATLAFYDGLIKPSYIGNEQFHHMRDLVRMYHTIRQQTTRIKNRIRQILDAHNQKYRFELNDEWGLELLDQYISGPLTLQQAYDAYYARLLAEGKSGKVMENRKDDFTLYGEIILNEEARFSLQLLLMRLLHEDTIAAGMVQRAEQLLQKDELFKEHYKTLLLVPGFGSITAMTLLVELGDYRRFTGWKQLAKFCGVVPGVADTGDHSAKRHVNHFSNPQIRYVLTQAAASLLNHSVGTTDLHQFVQRVAIREKGKFKKAAIKVAQKYARLLYQILVVGIPFDPLFQTTKKAQFILKRQERGAISMLEAARIRGLRRDIQRFLVTHSNGIDRKARFHLVHGFERLIKVTYKHCGLSQPKQKGGKKDEVL